jgi:hypothetical protein
MIQPSKTAKTGERKLKEATNDTGYLFMSQNQDKNPKLAMAKI